MYCFKNSKYLNISLYFIYLNNFLFFHLKTNYNLFIINEIDI